MRQTIVTDEVYLPRKYFIQLADFNDPTFKKLVEDFGISQNEEGHWPVFEIMRTLNGLRKRRGKVIADPKKDGELSIEDQLKFEKLQEARIKNNERLGRLVPVEVVKTRVRNDYNAVANMIRYGAKSAAVKVVFINNVRDCENILIDTWNKAIAYLEESSENVRWEEEGAQVKLGRTRMAEAAEEDSSGEDS